MAWAAKITVIFVIWVVIVIFVAECSGVVVLVLGRQAPRYDTPLVLLV